MEIDINTDIGEGFGRWKMGEDDDLMKIVSSANVACGFHAGDALSMTRMAEAAVENGVSLGAHVGLPDLLGFGRVPMAIEPEDFQKHALYQLGALAAIAKVAGTRVHHASTHGALGAMGRQNPRYTDLIMDALVIYDSALIMSTSANSPVEAYGRKIGMRTVSKIIADRAYNDDCYLVGRKTPGALITDPRQISDRVERFLGEGTIVSINGTVMPVEASSILVHSDTPGAVKIAETVRNVIERLGGQVTPMHKLSALAG